MKRFLLSLLSLVCLTAFAQNVRVVADQVASADDLSALRDGDVIMLKSLDTRTPYHAFNPGTLEKNEDITEDNFMVISGASWNSETGELKCRLQQKSSEEYLTSDLSLSANISDAFTFTIFMRTASGFDDQVDDVDNATTVSISDGGSNFLNTQGSSDEAPCGWRGGTAAWSVWYLYKVNGCFALIQDGGRYYIKTQASAYGRETGDFYYSSADPEDYDVYLKAEAEGDNEVWLATLVEDPDFGFTVQFQNAATDLYLGTNPNNDDPYGKKQSRAEEATIVLQNLTSDMNGYDNIEGDDASLFLLWSKRSSGSSYDSSSGDRYLVYPFAKGDGAALGGGMYYSNIVLGDANYGLVYRVFDAETGLPVAMPEFTKSAFDEFSEYIISITIPDPDDYAVGTEPGCLKNPERLREIVDRLMRLQEIPDEASDEEVANNRMWRELLAEAMALVEELNNLEYYPMVPGYYRFVCSFPGFMNQQGVEKAMASANKVDAAGNVLDVVAAWFTLDEGTPVVDEETGEETGEVSGLRQVWEVTEGEDGHLYVKNLATQRYFTNANTQSGQVPMAYEPQWVEFIPAGGGDFFLKIANQGYHMHCAGHSSGAGQSGFIVGWNGESKSCSAWYMRSITKEEIQEIWGEEIFDQAKIDAEMETLINQVKATLAESKVVEYKDKLITSAAQISSPRTQSGEGSIAALLDNDFSTYWHSQWSAGTMEFDSEDQMLHYLQFDLGAEYQTLHMLYACRIAVVNDKPASFSITAANSLEDEFEEVATIDEVGNENNVYYYYDLDLGAPYRYIRVRSTSSHGDYQRGYWHSSEMNFLSSLETTPDLFAKTGEIGEDLEAALAEALDLQTITRADIEKLKAAYEAFLAVYTSPTALKASIAKAENLVKIGGAGAGIGQKNDVAKFEALQAALAAAKTFLAEKLETCTKAEIEAQVKALDEAIAAWEAVEVVKLAEGVWYYIQCPTAPFEGVDYDPAEGSYYGERTSLRGGRVAVGHANEDDDKLAETNMHIVPTTLQALAGEDVKLGTYTVEAEDGTKTTEDNIVNYTYTDKCAQWRFIAAGDGAYYIQNRATGLFMPNFTATSGQIRTSYVPGKFTPAYYNGGIVNLVTEFVDMNNKELPVKESCLHMQVSGAVLVSWPTRATNGIANGSSWEIVEAGKVDPAEKQALNIVTEGMNVRGLTLPYAIDVLNTIESAGEINYITDVLGVNNETNTVYCKVAEETIPAGTPMFLFSSEGNDVNAYNRVYIVDDNFNWTVNNSGVIFGTLRRDAIINAGSAVPSIIEDEDFAWGALATIKKAQNATIGSAWLDINHRAESIFVNKDIANDITLVLDTKNGALFDVVEAVKAENGTVNVVYNLNGQRVSANVKGLVIIGGKKVFIK